MSDLKTEILFIGPPLSGPVSGGTLYNRYVIEELRKRHSVAVRSTLTQEEIRSASFHHVVVDSLSLQQVGVLRQEGYLQKVSLLLHYLPSFVATERACQFLELSTEERGALERTDSLIVTGAFMRNAIQSWTELEKPIHLVEPGFTRPSKMNSSDETAPRAQAPWLAVMLAPLTESKGIARFLEAVGAQCRESDRFEVLVAGRRGVEVRYEERLRTLIATNPGLAGRVRLLGELSHRAALHLLEGADCLVSCSRMESYGMALLEARQLGVLALALDKGNTREHAQPGHCEVFFNESELAHQFLSLARAPGHRSRRSKAIAHDQLRPWSTVAEEFLHALQSVDS